MFWLITDKKGNCGKDFMIFLDNVYEVPAIYRNSISKCHYTCIRWQSVGKYNKGRRR